MSVNRDQVMQVASVIAASCFRNGNFESLKPEAVIIAAYRMVAMNDVVCKIIEENPSIALLGIDEATIAVCSKVKSMGESSQVMTGKTPGEEAPDTERKIPVPDRLVEKAPEKVESVPGYDPLLNAFR